MLEKQAEQGRDIPALDERPSLIFEAEPIWVAFWEIAAHRVTEFNRHPIQISEILAWFDLKQWFDPELREWYYQIITQMDVHYRRLRADQDEAKKPQR